MDNALPNWKEIWEKHAHTITGNGYTVMQTWDFKAAYQEILDYIPNKPPAK